MAHSVILVHKRNLVLCIPKASKDEVERLCKALLSCVATNDDVLIGYSDDEEYIEGLLDMDGFIGEEKHPFAT